MRGKKDDASGPRIAIADNPTEPPRRPHHHGELPRQGAPPLARARTDNVKGSAVGEGEREEAQAARAAPVSLPISTSRAGRGEARRDETGFGFGLDTMEEEEIEPRERERDGGGGGACYCSSPLSPLCLCTRVEYVILGSLSVSPCLG